MNESRLGSTTVIEKITAPCRWCSHRVPLPGLCYLLAGRWGAGSSHPPGLTWPICKMEIIRAHSPWKCRQGNEVK